MNLIRSWHSCRAHTIHSRKDVSRELLRHRRLFYRRRHRRRLYHGAGRLPVPYRREHHARPGDGPDGRQVLRPRQHRAVARAAQHEPADAPAPDRRDARAQPRAEGHDRRGARDGHDRLERWRRGARARRRARQLLRQRGGGRRRGVHARRRARQLLRARGRRGRRARGRARHPGRRARGHARARDQPLPLRAPRGGHGARQHAAAGDRGHPRHQRQHGLFLCRRVALRRRGHGRLLPRRPGAVRHARARRRLHLAAVDRHDPLRRRDAERAPDDADERGQQVPRARGHPQDRSQRRDVHLRRHRGGPQEDRGDRARGPHRRHQAQVRHGAPDRRPDAERAAGRGRQRRRAHRVDARPPRHRPDGAHARLRLRRQPGHGAPAAHLHGRQGHVPLHLGRQHGRHDGVPPDGQLHERALHQRPHPHPGDGPDRGARRPARRQDAQHGHRDLRGQLHGRGHVRHGHGHRHQDGRGGNHARRDRRGRGDLHSPRPRRRDQGRADHGALGRLWRRHARHRRLVRARRRLDRLDAPHCAGAADGREARRHDQGPGAARGHLLGELPALGPALPTAGARPVHLRVRDQLQGRVLQDLPHRHDEGHLRRPGAHRARPAAAHRLPHGGGLRTRPRRVAGRLHPRGDRARGDDRRLRDVQRGRRLLGARHPRAHGRRRDGQARRGHPPRRQRLDPLGTGRRRIRYRDEPLRADAADVQPRRRAPHYAVAPREGQQHLVSAGGLSAAGRHARAHGLQHGPLPGPRRERQRRPELHARPQLHGQHHPARLLRQQGAHPRRAERAARVRRGPPGLREPRGRQGRVHRPDRGLDRRHGLGGLL